MVHLLERLLLIGNEYALSIDNLVCFLATGHRVALQRKLRRVYVVIITTDHLILLKHHLLMSASMHGPWWEDLIGPSLTDHTYSTLYLLLHFLSHSRLLIKRLLSLHADL